LQKAAEFTSNGSRILKKVKHEINRHLKKKKMEYVEDRMNDRPTYSKEKITTDLNTA